MKTEALENGLKSGWVKTQILKTGGDNIFCRFLRRNSGSLARTIDENTSKDKRFYTKMD